MSEKVRVVQFGLGPIGSAALRYALARDRYEIVGGVDIDPEKTGRDLGEIAGIDRSLGISVQSSIGDVLAETKADVAVHTTNSYFTDFKGQLFELLDAGLDVVSTSEELTFPWIAHPEDAGEIDSFAKEKGRTVAGTGVNPGFLMDALPLFLTSICQEVERIHIRRVINASHRREPFQRKIGAGMQVDEFHARMNAGKMGHVGLPESVGMIFDTLDKKLVRYESGVEPLIAGEAMSTEYLSVGKGEVRGLYQQAVGFSEDGKFVELEFRAAIDESPDGDFITIEGLPGLSVELKGTNGDVATVAIVVNAVKSVLDAEPGLMTMRDLPLVTFT